MTDQELKDLVAGLAAAQVETDREQRETSRELKELAREQRETSRELKELARETDRQFRRTDERIRALSEAADRRQQETDRQIKELGQPVGSRCHQAGQGEGLEGEQVPPWVRRYEYRRDGFHCRKRCCYTSFIWDQESLKSPQIAAHHGPCRSHRPPRAVCEPR